MSIMDFFRTQVTPQAAAPTQQAAAPTGENGKMPGSDQTTVNPLDAYAKIFDKVADKPEEAAPSFNIDPKVLNEVSSKLNFTQDISPELMQQATNGDSNALIQIMNQVAQSAYRASLSHASTLTDKFVGARTDHALKSVGSSVKKELTTSALSSTPNYQHPVVKEQLNRTAEAFAAQHPDATPQEIAKMAADYIQVLADAISPASNQQQTQKTAGEIDWSEYLSQQ